MIDSRIEVSGLREFRNGLRAMRSELPIQLRLANLAAAEIVAAEARSRASGLGGVAAKTAPSIKALGQQLGSAVRLGGARYPFAMGAEFGGGKYVAGRPSPRGGYTSQFKAWRGNGEDAGYFLYPAFRDKREEVIVAHDEMLNHLSKKAFPS